MIVTLSIAKRKQLAVAYSYRQFLFARIWWIKLNGEYKTEGKYNRTCSFIGNTRSLGTNGRQIVKMSFNFTNYFAAGYLLSLGN